MFTLKGDVMMNENNVQVLKEYNAVIDDLEKMSQSSNDKSFRSYELSVLRFNTSRLYYGTIVGNEFVDFLLKSIDDVAYDCLESNNKAVSIIADLCDRYSALKEYAKGNSLLK